jgi:predicted dinucleotide-binding enzyme
LAIDATNLFPVPDEVEGLPSSALVAKAFPGAKLVKGFNHLIAATLAGDPIVEGGKLHEGGALVHARGRSWGPLIFQDLFKKQQ